MSAEAPSCLCTTAVSPERHRRALSKTKLRTAVQLLIYGTIVNLRYNFSVQLYGPVRRPPSFRFYNRTLSLPFFLHFLLSPNNTRRGSPPPASLNHIEGIIKFCKSQFIECDQIRLYTAWFGVNWGESLSNQYMDCDAVIFPMNHASMFQNHASTW